MSWPPRSSWPAPPPSRPPVTRSWGTTWAPRRSRWRRRPGRSRPRRSVRCSPTFASRLPGYVGWHWAVTRRPRPRRGRRSPSTRSCCCPASRRCSPRVGAVARAAAPRRPLGRRRAALHRGRPASGAAYTADDDSADDPEGSVVAFELGLAGERVMSARGPARGRGRWAAGEFGPASSDGPPRPGPCVTCGFFLPLAGSLRSMLGACGNAYAPADGRVVTVDYGCGAHSQATLVVSEPVEVVTSARYDTSDFDVLTDQSSKAPVAGRPGVGGRRRDAWPCRRMTHRPRRPGRWPPRRSRSRSGRPGRRAAAGRRGRPPRGRCRPARRARCPPAGEGARLRAGPGTAGRLDLRSVTDVHHRIDPVARCRRSLPPARRPGEYASAWSEVPSVQECPRGASSDAWPATDGGTPADVVEGPAAPRRSAGPQVRPKNGLDRFFEISARRSTVGRELRGGLTTFFTMAYIVLLNPIILTSIPGLAARRAPTSTARCCPSRRSRRSPRCSRAC